MHRTAKRSKSMRKKILAVVLSCLTFLALILSVSGSSMRASAVTMDEMTRTAVQIITRSEGTYGTINANDNGAVSVGMLQWHADRAHQLMRTVASADPATAKSILGSSFYNEVISTSSWNTRTFTQTEANAASSLLSTSIGQSTQDDLAYQDVQGYINSGKKYGLTNAGVLVYYAELYNRGSGVAARILSAAKGSGAYGDITLSTLHNTALSDRGNSSGYYTKRLNNAYNTIVSLGWGDAAASEGGSSNNTQPAQPDTSDFSESYAGTYTVTASSLNMRSAPSTSASKVGKIPNGATVTVTSGNGSWAAVSYNGTSGYCSMDYLKAVNAAPAETTTAPVVTTAPETTTETTAAATEAVTTAASAPETTTVSETTEAPVTTTETTTVTTVTTPAPVQTTIPVEGVSDPQYVSVYGDLNCDGEITAVDAVLLQKYLNGSIYLNVTQLANADCQRDNILNTTDVIVILQYLINNIPALPVA